MQRNISRNKRTFYRLPLLQEVESMNIRLEISAELVRPYCIENKSLRLPLIFIREVYYFSLLIFISMRCTRWVHTSKNMLQCKMWNNTAVVA